MPKFVKILFIDIFFYNILRHIDWKISDEKHAFIGSLY